MKKGKTFGLFVAVFVATIILTFLFLGAILICINNFVEVDSKVWFWCCVGIVVVSTTISTLLVRNTKRIGKTRFSFWLGRNFPKLLLGYTLAILALFSIKRQPLWTTDVVYDILSLQWTIFGLSLTIFLVWNVIIVDFFKKRQPKGPYSSDLLQKYKVIMEKDSFSQEVETTFSTVVLLTFNLFLLLLSTSQVYISFEPDTVFAQNILRCSFFVTTNSIVCLFLDILKPLKKDKVELLKNNTVTKEDVDNALAALFAQAIIDGIKQGVMALDSEKYTEEEKKNILVEYLESLRESVRPKETAESEK